jgi:hypothetical protein
MKDKLVLLSNYCEKCKQEHNLPECANFLYRNECEQCGKVGLTFFSGGCCILKAKPS